MLHTVYISKGNFLIRFNVTKKEKSEKKNETSLSSKLVLAELDFLVAKGTTKGAMQIF